MPVGFAVLDHHEAITVLQLSNRVGVESVCDTRANHREDDLSTLVELGGRKAEFFAGDVAFHHLQPAGGVQEIFHDLAGCVAEHR